MPRNCSRQNPSSLSSQRSGPGAAFRPRRRRHCAPSGRIVFCRLPRPAAWAELPRPFRPQTRPGRAPGIRCALPCWESVWSTSSQERANQCRAGGDDSKTSGEPWRGAPPSAGSEPWVGPAQRRPEPCRGDSRVGLVPFLPLTQPGAAANGGGTAGCALNTGVQRRARLTRQKYQEG
jgi:hypothetical protein